MSIAYQKLIKFFSFARGFFPESLPVGMSEFHSWAESISNNYELPTKDLDSVKFTLASIVMHLGPSIDSKSKYYFVKQIRASAAKQIAGAAFYEIKQQQKSLQEAAAKAALEKQQAEATAPQVASDVPVQH